MGQLLVGEVLLNEFQSYYLVIDFVCSRWQGSHVLRPICSYASCVRCWFEQNVRLTMTRTKTQNSWPEFPRHMTLVLLWVMLCYFARVTPLWGICLRFVKHRCE